MNLTEALSHVDWTVVDELHHIPRGRKGSLQEALRVEYAAFRTLHRSLNSELRPRDALAQAVYNLQRTHPEFEPRYDRGFFFENGLMSSTLAEDPLMHEIHLIAAGGGGSSRVIEMADVNGRIKISHKA